MLVRKTLFTAAWVMSAMHVASLSAAADSRIAEAAKRHDLDAVRALLKQHVDVNAALPDGATALHWAAQWDDAALADMLVLAHANVNATDVYGVTPPLAAKPNDAAVPVVRSPSGDVVVICSGAALMLRRTTSAIGSTKASCRGRCVSGTLKSRPGVPTIRFG